MVEGEEVSADGLTWTFKLRAGLKFHDGEPVLAKDVVASLDALVGARRHGPDAQGASRRSSSPSTTAPSNGCCPKPYPEDAARARQEQHADAPSSCRSASPRPTRSSRSTSTSARGPMKFARAEWVPGAKAVFEKFDDYVPRNEPASWLAGGKRMMRRPHRVDHHARSRHRLGGAAERRDRLVGDADPRPRARAARSNRNIKVDIADPLGNIGSLPHEPPAPALQQREGAPRGADGAEPGRLHARAWSATTPACGSRCRASSRRARRSTPRRAARSLKGKRDIDARQEAAGGEPATTASRSPAWWRRTSRSLKAHGRGHGRPAEEDRHDRRFRRHRLGHGRPAPRLEERRRGRAAGACSTPGMPAPTAPTRRPTSRSAPTARRPGSAGPTARGREGGRGLVRRQEPRRGEGGDRPPQQGGDGARRSTSRPASSTATRPGAATSRGVVKGPLPFFWGVTKACMHGAGRPRMLAYIVRRILATIPVMAIVALFVFSLLYIAPGDPAAVIAGDQATPEDVERIRAGLGLDRPFLVRFGEWVWQHPARRPRHVDLHRPAGDRADRAAHRADAVADGRHAHPRGHRSPCRWAWSRPGRPGTLDRPRA